MDPQHQRGFLVSEQRPPEATLLPPDKDANLGLLGTPTLTNQFYPGSREVDPVNSVNNLPVPDRNYRQSTPVYDKRTISTDVMLSKAVTVSKCDDELIRLSQEQNGTAQDSRRFSPGLLDIQFPMSPGNSPDNSDTMDYGMFDLGPNQDERTHSLQFSAFNRSNSNFGSPASDEQHPIEDGQAMETEGDALATEQERQTYPVAQNQMGHNADALPIAPAQLAHGAGQFDVDDDFYVGQENSDRVGSVEHSFRTVPDVSEHEDQLHMEPTLETTGQTYNYATNSPNCDASHVVNAQDQRTGCLLDNLANFCAPHDGAPHVVGVLDHPEFCQRQIEPHQQVEGQDAMMDVTSPSPQFYKSHNVMQGGTEGHTFRADEDVAGHEGQLHLEPGLATSVQTTNFVQNMLNYDASRVVRAPDQQMGWQPGGSANVNKDARRVLGAQDHPEPADTTTVGEFCQRQMELQWQAERQRGQNRSIRASPYRQGDHYPEMGAEHQPHQRKHGTTSNEAHQPIGNHFSQDQAWSQPTMGNRLAEQPVAFNGPMRHEQGDCYTEMDEVYQIHQWQHGTTSNEAPQSYGNHFYRGQEDPQAGRGPLRHFSYGQEDHYPQMNEATPRRSTPHGQEARQFTGNHPITDASTIEMSPYGRNSQNQEILPRQEALHGMNLRYQGVESGSCQRNSGIVEAPDNVTGGPGNCRLEFGRIKRNTPSASLSDHYTYDQFSTSGESGVYSSPSTPDDHTTTDSSTSGLLPPIATNEVHTLTQLFLPNFTVQSRTDEGFQQLQRDLLMDYPEDLEGMGNDGFVLIDNNDNDIGFDVEGFCETYQYYAKGMDNWQPMEILTDEDMEYFSTTGSLISDNNEGSTSSSPSLPARKKRRKSYKKSTKEQRDIRKKETNRKASSNNVAKKRSVRDTAQKILKYIQNEIKTEQAAITDVEDNVAFANELLDLTGRYSPDLRGILQEEEKCYLAWKSEITQILDSRRDGDRTVQDALQKKQSAREEFEKIAEEYQSTEDKKKKPTIGSQKTRALQKHELMDSQYHILVNRHDLRRETFLKGLADLYFRRTVSRYIQRIWLIPVEVIQLLNQQQKMLQLHKLQNFLRANRHLLKAPF